MKLLRILAAASMSLPAIVVLATNIYPAEPLVASTFLGDVGKDGSIETPLVVDAQGNIFVASRTQSLDFPVVDGSYDTDDHNGGTDDIFVSKFSPDLTTLLASTYLGGSGDEGTWPGVAMTIDADGNIYVAGRTTSADFPHNYGSLSGVSDAFVAKFDNNLENLMASRLLGGSGNEYFLQLAIDADGYLFVSGTTSSSDFTTTAGAAQSTYGGAGGGPYAGDLFVRKYSSDLSSLLASTFLGGTMFEYCEELVINDAGEVYLAGWVASGDFPTTETAYDTIHGGGGYDAFVSALSNDLTTLVGSTFIGGTAWDFIYGMNIDGDGNVYVTGHTQSEDYPTTSGAWDQTYNGFIGTHDDAFISKFDASLENLLASTYFGASTWDFGMYLEFTESGDILLAGCTESADLAVPMSAYDPSYNGGQDSYIALFTGDLTWRKTATFLGGSSRELPTGLIMLSSGDVCLGGITISSNYPIVETSYDPSFNGSGGAWIDGDGETYGGDVVITIFGGEDFSIADPDADGIPAYIDNCRDAYNPSQTDSDFDLIGDACDPCTDFDDDGFSDPGFPASTCAIDNCPDIPNQGQGDLDSDSVGNECDNCLLTYNPDQEDLDGNGIGDACDGCCVLRVGDANGLGGDEPTIGDISVMIDAKFITGTCLGILDCLAEADINLSGGSDPICDDITIGDISTLIDYLFITGQSLGLPYCP